MRPIQKQVMVDVVANTTSVAVETQGHPYVTLFCVTTGGTVGGTISFQGSLDGTTWAQIATTAVASATVTVQCNALGASTTAGYASWKFIRAVLTSWTAGTFNVWLNATGNAGPGP